VLQVKVVGQQTNNPVSLGFSNLLGIIYQNFIYDNINYVILIRLIRLVLIRPHWRKVVALLLWPVPEAAVTVLCIPDDRCDGHPKHVE